MSDLSQLLFGIALVIAGFGSLIVSRERNGKTAWFVGKSFIEPVVSVMIICSIALGLILLAAYFTKIDDVTMVR